MAWAIEGVGAVGRRWARCLSPIILSGLAILIWLSGCRGGGATSVPDSPLATATPVPLTSVPTITPFPSPAPTPTTTPVPIHQGLSDEERERLNQSALQYVAATHSEAITVARELHFLVDDGHPSNMCGPLAIAILRDAGLVDPHVILHDYWLLNPAEPWDVRLLESIFPRSRYLWVETATPVNQFDFAQFPLEAGDFVYLLMGSGGTFEHVLVVSRTEEGRAFAVSNVNSRAGFLIEEVMLYNLAQPGAGMFIQWTDPANLQLGLTGLGGFRVWRRVETLPRDASELGVLWSTGIESALQGRGGHWNVLVKRFGGGLLYSRMGEEIVAPISAVHIPVAMLFFHALDRQGVRDIDAYVETNGIHDRTFAQLLEAMLVEGEETATWALIHWIDGQLDIAPLLKGWGLHQTTLDRRQSSPWDEALALERLYAGAMVSDKARALILEMAGRYQPDGAVTLCTAGEDGCLFWRPATGDDGLLAGGSAIIERDGELYVVVVYARSAGYGEPEVAPEEVSETLGDVMAVFASEAGME